MKRVRRLSEGCSEGRRDKGRAGNDFPFSRIFLVMSGAYALGLGLPAREYLSTGFGV